MRKKISLSLTLLFTIILLTLCGCNIFLTSNTNRKFEQFTHRLFVQEVSSNTLTLHYTLKNPEQYGISDIPISLGSMDTDSAAVCAAAENSLAALHKFQCDSLSRKNQQTYAVLESYLQFSLDAGKYLLYEEPLAPLTGTQAQLPVILSEYEFYDVSDIETYLSLLAQIPNYFQNLITFEQAKSDAGLFMSSRTADKLIEECSSFIQMDENYLITSFDQRIDSMSLGEEIVSNYKKSNRDAVGTYVIPAYQNLIDCLTNLRDTGTNSGGLCNLPDGASYYELSIKSQTGSSRSIHELQQLTQRQLISDLKALQTILNGNTDNLTATSDLFKTSGQILENNDPAQILNQLKEQITSDFPPLPEAKNIDYQIKYVSEAMQPYLSPAFYMIPPIDDTENNVIYINSGHIADDISLFTTLAHEGYPGHLYQTTYYAATNPDPIRTLLNFGGYTEGWATYCEMLSYYYLPIPKEQAALMQHNASILLGLYALTDMGIHYDGWTLLDAVSFFRGYGITDMDTIEEIYDLIVADPGNYLKYYIGYVEFLELKKDAIKKWGNDFSQERFHLEILEAGPATFDILRDRLLNITSQKCCFSLSK